MNSSVTELTVDIPITVNELAQDDKAFSVQLSLPSPTSRVSIAPSTTQVTIIDDNSMLISDCQGYLSSSSSTHYRCDDWLSTRELPGFKASRLCNIESKSTSGNTWPNSVPPYSNQ